MAYTVLLPLDGSEMAEHAFDHVLDRYPDASLVLAHVVDVVEASYRVPLDAPVPSYWDDWYDEATAEARNLLGDFADRAEAAGHPVETDVRVGQAAREILGAVDDHDVDQVVMGSHGRSGVSRVLLGSVAETVCRRSPVPVTVVR